MKKVISLLALCLIVPLTLVCQTSSKNSYPKTVTGAVNFGKDTFSVFTQVQKMIIMERLEELENCQYDAILDSQIISHYEEKSQLDSAAISDLERQHRLEASQLMDFKRAIFNRNEQIVKDSIYSVHLRRTLKKQTVLKKTGTTLGAVLGFIGGVFVGFLTYPLVHR